MVINDKMLLMLVEPMVLVKPEEEIRKQLTEMHAKIAGLSDEEIVKAVRKLQGFIEKVLDDSLSLEEWQRIGKNSD